MRLLPIFDVLSDKNSLLKFFLKCIPITSTPSLVLVSLQRLLLHVLGFPISLSALCFYTTPNFTLASAVFSSFLHAFPLLILAFIISALFLCLRYLLSFSSCFNVSPFSGSGFLAFQVCLLALHTFIQLGSISYNRRHATRFNDLLLCRTTHCTCKRSTIVMLTMLQKRRIVEGWRTVAKRSWILYDQSENKYLVCAVINISQFRMIRPRCVLVSAPTYAAERLQSVVSGRFYRKLSLHTEYVVCLLPLR